MQPIMVHFLEPTLSSILPAIIMETACPMILMAYNQADMLDVILYSLTPPLRSVQHYSGHCGCMK